MWDLTSLNRDRTHIPCMGRLSYNHWTTREVPHSFYFSTISPFTDWCQMEARKKTNKQTKNLFCSCPKVEHFPGEDNTSTWFLKSPKAHHRIQPSWSMPRQKGILLMIRDNQLPLIILRWSLNGSIAILWRRMKNDAILYMKAFVPLHQGGEKSDSCHLMVQETWGKICDVRRQRNKGENTFLQLWPS